MVDQQIRIAPSLLSADFGAFREAAIACWDAGASGLHFDVMDGLFVPNITFGTHPIAALRKDTDAHFEAHLMIESPERYIEDYANAGADTIIIQAESTIHLQRTLSLIRQCGKKAGIALNPATPLCALEYVMDDLDHILIMTVNPGFSGQKFIPAMIQKVSDAAMMIEASNPKIFLEVDGGVSPKVAYELSMIGVTALVSGSSIFSHADGIKGGIDAIVEATVMGIRQANKHRE